ncbi:MAG: hypothetical protein P1P72_10910, partial [ANME-2 cluster archaeon]|nr:hypothetical protein [ANME-2 cluster archaeon]
MKNKGGPPSGTARQRYSVKRLTSLAIVMVLALIVFSNWIAVAMAAGKPTELITFTDKRVYADWQISQDKSGVNAPFTEKGGTLNNDLVVYVYAMVLDDDGKIMTGRSASLSGTLNGEKRLDHYDKADSTYHHSETTTTVFDGYT